MITHTVTFYKSKGECRWRITARNGKIICVASEGYKRRIDCHRAYIRLVDAIQGMTLKVEGEK
jgi:uncharacterized protein YegP (UPF0339 family)